MNVKKLVAAVVLGGALLAGAAAPAQAQRYDRCEQRVRKAQMNLRRAVSRHGARSRQAQQRRYQLERARESCREHRR